MTTCQICSKPRHETVQISGHNVILCREAPRDAIVFVDEWRCKCCKCDQIIELARRRTMDAIFKPFPVFEPTEVSMRLPLPLRSSYHNLGYGLIRR